MDEFTYTYEVERVDTANFHGWIVLECSIGMKETIYRDTNLDNIKAFMHDLGASC